MTTRTPESRAASYKTDMLAHFDIGPQYDFSRGFGVYLSGGLTFQMLRYFGCQRGPRDRHPSAGALGHP